MNRSRGRPRGGESGARERILEVARASFLASGYGGTTLRAVAARAGTDPALISYHFHSKQGLFAAAMALNDNPAQVLRAALQGPPRHLAQRLLNAIVDTWDASEHGRPLTALVSAALSDQTAMRVFHEYLEREIVERLAEHLGGPDATERASSAVAIIAGAIFTRYILRLTPIAGLPAEAFKRSLTPALDLALHPGRPARSG